MDLPHWLDSPYRFVQLVRKYQPHCLLHFEDFGVSNAQRLLELYRNEHSVFNDDMYGSTSSMVCLIITML
jgi:malate dehydrogenase (oxaloacetate-decarboxylating)